MTATPRPLGDNRETFMARVRAALERTGPTTPPTEPAPAVDESLARLASTDDDLVAMFSDRAKAVGMQVHPVGRADAMSKLMELLAGVEARRVAVSAGALEGDLRINDALQQGGVAVVNWQAAPGFEIQYDLDAGITDVHAALAETGTLVACSDRSHSRGLSLVPPVHVALVRRSDILPDMIDYWARLKGLPNTELPSSQAFITGPSKTADIEGELITGVHGPRAVHILVIEDM